MVGAHFCGLGNKQKENRPKKIISSNTYLISENILVSHEEGGPAFPSSSNLRAGSMPRPRFVDLGSEPQDS